jgi:beta-glucanase (GH16 family)
MLYPDKQMLHDQGTRQLSLVWSDEFEYSGKPDPEKWTYEEGFIRNKEDQYYTNQLKNVRVENGKLIIEAHKEAVKNTGFAPEQSRDWRKNRAVSAYTSGSISTEGRAEWLYGRIEVCAKLPKGRGTWPAIWMLGTNRDSVGWPKCGEIDIMEHVGFDPDSIFGTVHTEAYNHMKGTQKGKRVFIEDPYDEFHCYIIEWTPEKIDFLLDGERYYTVRNEHKTADEWPFDQPFYLKLNIAVGGGLGGKRGIDDSIFPQKMEIDYVRVYQ